MNPIGRAGRRYLITVTTLIGLLTIGIGVWCLIDPGSFAQFVGFGEHEHFLHDVGAFQVGLGATLLLALIWSDALATSITGFLLANTIHTVNHVLDLNLGGSPAQAWLLGATSAALAFALVLRLRQLGYVLGYISGGVSGNLSGTAGCATDPALARFVRQKTIRLTTFRKDGSPGTSPVSIAVDGDRAYFRSFERAVKVRRVRRNPNVEFGPATMSGNATGAMQPGRVRLLDGAESRQAARLLRRKYPLLHGLFVPAAHRLGRSKYGRTVHFELVPSMSCL
ncbi:PPOX class F420-dependent enzyme [Mycobacterium angelicum]|uniref:PPOX class F420-dependent enzyme n=2 Tax=Mycobacterium angelicum TaxID=470074 RepID=A0A1W9Z8G2_MYCAN|nr:PPOX class F420-dependent oxidoreductase [Mycobacterium angelicum]MCV7195941.1 PPOX class F420-dependent oxidoreductase [Mycobacterium angelicum]ORA08603.1 PPOX class F420-dependent enzyme [Mycobacterium angelicum]